jgi:hypothetical protein
MADSFKTTLAFGNKGKSVALAQEWLTFHGCNVVIDGEFGEATQLATRNFQTKKKVPVNGTIDAPTQDGLLQPIAAVQKPIAPGTKTLGELYIAYARQHLKEHPVELGGQNCGPWVRLYMNGNEGEEWPWCAGFATWVLRQACATLGKPMPHQYGFSCDVLALKAQASGRFLPVRRPADAALVKPGYLFLVRRTPADWTHVGIVEAVDGGAMTTIEGNTNDQGSREGFEVCRRTRSIADKDFLIV